MTTTEGMCRTELSPTSNPIRVLTPPHAPPGIMVRLMLVAAPAFVLLSAISISNTLASASRELRLHAAATEAAKSAPAAEAAAAAAPNKKRAAAK